MTEGKDATPVDSTMVVPRRITNPVPPAKKPASRLGRYTLVEELAEGGMGKVYLARRDGAAGISVLKVLRADMLETETVRRRFLREAQLAAYLNHPNIARLLGAGVEEEVFCIELELIVGKDLESMMHGLYKQRKLLPYPVTISAIAGILAGLEYAHAATDPTGRPMQIVHRDLSPRNMMFTFDGVAKVIDFGVARANVDDFKTAPGMVMGTFRYVSPEMARADPIDRRSDIYATGVVLYELLSGVAVVPVSENPRDMLLAVTLQKPQALSDVSKSIPPDVSDVVMRAIEKNPSDRWATAGEFRSALLAAAPPGWAVVEADQLSEFIRTWFSEDAKAADRLRGMALDEPASEPTKTFEAPGVDEGPVLPPVVPVELTDEVEDAVATRTGFVFPQTDQTAAGRTAVIVPSTTAPISLAQPSRPPAPGARVGEPSRPPQPLSAKTVGLLSALGGSLATLFGVWLVLHLAAPARQVIAPPTSVESTEPAPVGAKALAPAVSLAPESTPRPRAPLSPTRATPKPLIEAPATPPRPTDVASTLRRLLRRLEASYADPISDDPAFDPFLAEARRVAAGLPGDRGVQAQKQLRLLEMEPTVARVRQTAAALEGP